jgi:competence protein ComEC
VFGLVGLAWFAFFKDRWRLLGPALVVPLVAIFAVDQPPDVLIADTTQAIAIRGPSGLELADGKPQSFALNIWRETYAEPIDRQAAESCDSLACVGTSAAGFTYAIVSDPAALPDECGHADLLVVRSASPSWCTAKALVTADDLARHGVRWLRWDAARQGFEVRPAISMLGRPWRIAR